MAILKESTLKYFIKKAILKEINELMAYHGSNANFDKFDMSKSKSGSHGAKYGKGIYLTVDKTLADFYATFNYNVAGTTLSPDGIIYTVEAPDYDGTNYIFWEKPIGNGVYENIKDYWEDPYDPTVQEWITPRRTGREIFNNVGKNWSHLSDYGIVGVEVPEAGGDERVVNFIIFDDENVKIIKKEKTTFKNQSK